MFMNKGKKKILIYVGCLFICACIGLSLVFPFFNKREIVDSSNVGSEKGKGVETRSGDNWWDSNWSYRKLITLNTSQISNSFTNFPILINLSSDSDLASDAQESGNDICFIDYYDNTTHFNHEIEYFDGDTGQLIVWVNDTVVSSSNNKFWCYYSNSGTGNQENVTDTWDSHYIFVQHLNDDPDNSHTVDSTVYDNDGVKTGANSPLQSSNRIGYYQDFSGSNRVMMDETSVNADVNGCSAITMSAWVNLDNAPAQYSKIIHCYIRSTNPTCANGFQMYVDSSRSFFTGGRSVYTESFESQDSGTDLTLDTWYYVTGVLDINGDYIYTYVNGLPTTSGAKTFDNTVYTDSGTHQDGTIYESADIGSQNSQNYLGWDGFIDEARVSDITRSASWINTEYNNMYNSTLGESDCFFEIGSEETSGCTTSVDSIVPYWQDSVSTVTVTATTDSGSPSNVTLWYRWSLDNSSWDGGSWAFNNDTVDNNESDIDASADVGIETGFPNCQDVAPDYDNMTLQETNTGGGGNGVFGDTSEFGSDFLLADNSKTPLEYQFARLISCTETCTVDNISAYLNTDSTSNVNIKYAIYTGDGSPEIIISNGETNQGTLGAGTTAWVTCSFATPPTLTNGNDYYLAVLADYADVGNNKIVNMRYQTTGDDTIIYSNGNIYPTSFAFDSSWTDSEYTVDSTAEASIYCNYTTGSTNYELDMEYNWTGVNFSETVENLCIYVNDTSGNENLLVNYWDGDSWELLDTIDGTGWFNSTATGLTGVEYFIQFIGASESSDTTQDFWDIDCIFLETYNSSGGSNGYNWSIWNDVSNPDTVSPWSWVFDCPNETGYYEFYTIGNESGTLESAPSSADAICHVNYTTPSNPVDMPVINFAGSLSSEGGPERLPLTYDYAPNGYYTSNSQQSNNYILMNVSCSNATSVKLNYTVNGGSSWVNGSEAFEQSGNYWVLNLTDKTTTGLGFSFDVYAYNTNYYNVTAWEKKDKDNNTVRRWVKLGQTPNDDILDMELLYFYKEDYTAHDIDAWGADVQYFDQGTNTDNDSGVLVDTVPTDDVTFLECGESVWGWWNKSVCMNPDSLVSVTYHIWDENSEMPTHNPVNGSLRLGKDRGINPETDILDYNKVWLNATQVIADGGTQIQDLLMDGYTYTLYHGTLYLSSPYTNITTNNIYELAVVLFGEDGSPHVFSNRSANSWVIFNIYDNGTLQGLDSDSDGLSDYTEIWVTDTNIELADTDNDGVNDFWEYRAGSDPNNFWETDNVSWVERFDYWFSGGNVSGIVERFDFYFTGGNIVGFSEQFNYWFSGGNTSRYVQQFDYYFSGGNGTVTFAERFDYWFSGGNISDYVERFDYWFSGGNVSGFVERNDFWFSGGNISVGQNEHFDYWFSGGNVSGIVERFDFYFTGGNIVGFSEQFNYYFTGRNVSSNNERFDYYFSGGNISIGQIERFDYWFTGGNISDYVERFNYFFIGGNISSEGWIEQFNYWFTGGNILGFVQRYDYWFSGGNESVNQVERFDYWFSGGNISSEGWNNRFNYWFSGGNVTGFIQRFDYWFTGGNTSIVFLTISSIYPSNNSINVNLQPYLFATFNSSSGKTMNCSWYYGLSYGNETTLLATDSNFSNSSTINHLFFNATDRFTTYYWKIILDDGTNNLTELYNFRTEGFGGFPGGVGIVSTSNVFRIFGLIGLLGVIGFVIFISRRRKEDNDGY